MTGKQTRQQCGGVKLRVDRKPGRYTGHGSFNTGAQQQGTLPAQRALDQFARIARRADGPARQVFAPPTQRNRGQHVGRQGNRACGRGRIQSAESAIHRDWFHGGGRGGGSRLT